MRALFVSLYAFVVVPITVPLRAQTTIVDCTSSGAQSQCATSSPSSLTTYETCTTFNGQQQCSRSGVPPLPLLGVGLKQTHCVGDGGKTDCVTTSPTQLTEYTSCHGAPGALQCGPPTLVAPPSLSLVSPAQWEADQREHQAEIQNEARGAVVIGRGVARLFHSMHASNQRAKEARLADLNARFASLNHDYAYGATLVSAAQARGDTAAVRRLSADQVEMSQQLSAIADSAAKVAH